MAACPQCGEPVGPGSQGFVWGYGYAEDGEGNRVEDSEVTVGLFHPDCWPKWKAEHGGDGPGEAD